MMQASIFEIKRFAVHDGDGIRTTVFFKGCPLKCLWCHNPEGLAFNSEMAYYQNKCISCGECISICKNNAHIISDNGHTFDKRLCIACGDCESACLGEAMKLYGRQVTVEELIPILLEDKDFYVNSGGGVTLSGGECLIQYEFCRALLSELKNNGINTAVDTCGYVKREAIDAVIPYTDIFLYDVKAADEDIHIKCTGVSNKLILENLFYIDSLGKKTEVRIPFVPLHNSDQIEKISEILLKLRHLTGVRVLPYHNYAGSKYTALDLTNTLPAEIPHKNDVTKAEQFLLSVGLPVKN